MLTMIEFYDKDILKNALAVLTMRPDRVVYIYDDELKDMNRFLSLEKCFKKHIPNIVVEKVPADISRIKNVYDATYDVIKTTDECMINLTGGSELMILGGYRAGFELGAQLLYTDITKREIVDIKTNKLVANTAGLSLEDFIDAHGAELIGNSHVEPKEEEFDRILSVCKYLFNNINAWKETCMFFQVVMAVLPANELRLATGATVQQKNGKKVSVDRDMLYELQKYGFINDLVLTDKHVSLNFVSKKYRSYLISYGVWLELFVYINGVRAGVFDDVKLGAMIDWDAYDGITVAGNEFDVIIQDGSIPVFVSCKLRSADTAALNELVIAKKRLGGWFSKSIIVVFSDDKRLKSGTYKKAKELGVELLDKGDILSNNFPDRLIKAVKEHDLVSMKWKKV